MKRSLVIALAMFGIAIASALPAHAGWNPFKKKEKDPEFAKTEAAETIKNFKEADSGMEAWFKKAYGYAVFSTVGKGGMGIGGAYGKGLVYEKDKLIGKTSLKQVSIGFQFGGQSYSELVLFKDKKALDAFRKGNFEFGAQVSAVAVTRGASKDAAFDGGIAVFTLSKGGLMYEASVGGQKFTFKANEDEE